MITTVHTDVRFSVATCPDPTSTNNGFEFLTRVNIATGTVIYFTDNGYTSTGEWRSGEGTLIYTAPRLIAAGEYVYYNDCETVVNPSVWTRVNNWDPAVNGDNILAYQ